MIGGRPVVKAYAFLPDAGNLPACLSYAGYFTFVSKLTETDTANAVFAKVSMGAAADLAAVMLTGGELLGSGTLEDH